MNKFDLKGRRRVRTCYSDAIPMMMSNSIIIRLKLLKVNSMINFYDLKLIRLN